MANTPPIGEPSAAGNRPSGLWTPGSIASGVNIDLPGLTQASTQINSVTSALYGLKAALRDVGSGSYMLAQGVNNLFQGITRSASKRQPLLAGYHKLLARYQPVAVAAPVAAEAVAALLVPVVVSRRGLAKPRPVREQDQQQVAGEARQRLQGTSVSRPRCSG